MKKIRVSMLNRKNPSYRHGKQRKVINYYCPKCGNKLANGHSKQCRKCYLKTMKGKGNPNFGNKTRSRYYCTVCGKEVTRKESLRCHSCACKFIWKSSNKMQERDFQGKNNPNYIHGQGNFPYPIEFNNELKEQIRKRDNYTCQNCNIIEEEHIIIQGKVLSIHHIDYDKTNNQKNNLITLCNQCNVRANYNRKHWQEFYTNKITAN